MSNLSNVGEKRRGLSPNSYEEVLKWQKRANSSQPAPQTFSDGWDSTSLARARVSVNSTLVDSNGDRDQPYGDHRRYQPGREPASSRAHSDAAAFHFSRNSNGQRNREDGRARDEGKSPSYGPRSSEEGKKTQRKPCPYHEKKGKCILLDSDFDCSYSHDRWLCPHLAKGFASCSRSAVGQKCDYAHFRNDADVSRISRREQPLYWRGAPVVGWMRMLKLVIDLETDALTPRQLKTHQNPDIMVEMIENWFASMKEHPDRSFRDHLLLLYEDACPKCFHLHPTSAECFCPCWLKISALLSSGVSDVHSLFASTKPREKSGYEAEDCVLLDDQTAGTPRDRSPSHERDIAKESFDDRIIAVDVDASCVEPVSSIPDSRNLFEESSRFPNPVQSYSLGGLDHHVKSSETSRVDVDITSTSAEKPILVSRSSPVEKSASSIDPGPQQTRTEVCGSPDPSFIAVLSLDPTIDVLGILENRECHTCLDDRCDAVDGVGNCRVERRLCLVCFHRHSRLLPCACDCKQKAWRISIPEFDFKAVLQWDQSNRRDLPPAPTYTRPNHRLPPFVAFLLRGLTWKVALFAEKAFCRVCLTSTHATNQCVEGYLCLFCFHEHSINTSCRCKCLLNCVTEVLGARFNAEEVEKVEMQRQKDPALLEFMADRRAQFFERAGMDTMGRKLATVANEINTAARSQTENPFIEVNDKRDKNSKPVETTEKDEEPNHVIPKFVLYLLREFDSSKMTLLRIICDSYSGDSYFRPERRRRCLMCFDSGHSTENCKDGFLCLNCFHTHEIGGKCKCFCYLKSLEKSSRKIFSGRTSKFETMNRLLEINERRIQDFGRKGGAADGARNTGTSNQNQLDDVSEVVGERPEQETIQDEPSNHVIPKFVLYLLREFDCSKITLVRMIKDYYLGRPGEVCLVCFDGHHRTIDCKDEFLCLACFHNHRMEAKCSCFCYLSTIEKSPKKIILGKFETSIRRTRMEISELNKKRIRILTEYINTMKSMPPLPEKQSVAPPSDPLKVPGLMDLTFFEATSSSGSPGPNLVPPPPSLTSIATPLPNPVPPPPSMVPAPVSAPVPPPPVKMHESSPLVSESLGFGELWIDFKFLDFEYSSHINFASALENESLRVRASKNDTCAKIKLSLFHMLRRHSIEPTVAGTVTLIM